MVASDSKPAPDDIVWSVGWSGCRECVLSLREESEDMATPARQLLGETYVSTMRGLKVHRSLASFSLRWSDVVVQHLGRILEASTETDKVQLRAKTIPPLQDAFEILGALVRTIDSEREAFNSAIGGLIRFRAEVSKAFNTERGPYGYMYLAIADKLENALTCFQATEKALSHASSILKSDASDMAQCMCVLKAFLSVETIETSRVAELGNRLIACCNAYKRKHAEYCRVFM
ncbi:hypothetical protein SPRG_00715 [Saprolegnia parasitica CBS 223.65]|uniref:Uncharacterized protein n=1 Tax=Saprolegnia parasitica (strain CBS 223.65) TaxID=695850 RepID=A0A067D6M8_SAPPC|nr:hypothetical protein SPRG_00715 [Saprolegnia parasitica CBS 223.65]KDO34652.1 hypothetical protein SPRG_00715 [Saprolegnia parasitica CBS 223.65]|eukprot:XP_012194326.1 hypothetical protein SPRG_00715 [Saprolegnia parasitica CBS 223.65]